MKLKEFLMQDKEPCPEWLSGFTPGACFDRGQFFNSRVVYYPGYRTDGHAVRLFGSSHSAHCFVYADYLGEKESLA